MKTKEFAELCKVDKRTLFYYDEIGLLKPQKVLDNGYREYSRAQLCTMETIKLLQSTGMSLSEVRALLNNELEEDNGILINDSIKRLEEEINKLSDAKIFLENRMNLRACYMRHVGEDIFTERLPARKLAAENPDFRSMRRVSYSKAGYYLDVAIDLIEAKPRYLFKMALPTEESVDFEEGNYVCRFVEAEKIIYALKEVKRFADDVAKLGYVTEDVVYMERLQTWIINRADGIICRLAAKLKEDIKREKP